MSQEQPMHGHALPARRQFPIRLEQLKRSPLLNIIGMPELIGLAAATLLALIMVFAYFSFYIPAHSRLRSAQLDMQRLKAEIPSSETNFEKTTSAREAVDKITSSLDEFEARLPIESSGRVTLYATLNELIKNNSLRNTAGPTYAPLEPVGTKNQVQPTASAEKQSNAKWQTIYPGIAVSVTVEGSYQNVWRFVKDIETNSHFLIINAVELEGVTQSNSLQDRLAQSTAEEPAGPSRNKADAGNPTNSNQRGALVSLRLDLATYFQRAGQNGASNP